MQRVLIASMMALGLAAPAGVAFAAPAVPATGPESASANTVNSYTPAQERRARAAATRAGFRPEPFLWSQDGYIFLLTTRAGEPRTVTVAPDGTVIPSPAVIPVPAVVPAAAGAAPARAPAR